MVEASERGGTLFLNSQKTTVEMPLVFQDTHELDALSAQVSWSRSGGDTELWINNISFSNAHLAGSVFGVYRTAGSDERQHRSHRPPHAGRRALRGPLHPARGGEVGARLARRRVPRRPIEQRHAAPQGQARGFSVPTGHGPACSRSRRGSPTACCTTPTAGPTSRTSPATWSFAAAAWTCTPGRARFSARASRRCAWRFRTSAPDKSMLNVAGEAEGPTGEFLAFIEKSPVSGHDRRFHPRLAGAGHRQARAEAVDPARAIPRRARSRAPTSSPAIRSRSLPSCRPWSRRADGSSSPRSSGARAEREGRPARRAGDDHRDDRARRPRCGSTCRDASTPTRSAAPAAPQWVQHLRGATDWRATLDAPASAARTSCSSRTCRASRSTCPRRS